MRGSHIWVVSVVSTVRHMRFGGLSNRPVNRRFVLDDGFVVGSVRVRP